MSEPQSNDTNPNATHSSTDTKTTGAGEPLYGGYTRFELELEVPSLPQQPPSTPYLPANFSNLKFVQSLANPYYLNFLASQKLLSDPTFISYLHYLQYFQKPEYIKYLLYPGPTLKALVLLQQEQFRQDILSPDTVARLAESQVLASIAPR